MATDDKREVRVRVFVNQTWFEVDDAGNRSRVRDEEGMSDERRSTARRQKDDPPETQATEQPVPPGPFVSLTERVETAAA
jgi:hypothetical protein